MPPKYKGDEEDWLDEERSKGAGPRAPKKKPPSKKPIVVNANATVAEVYPNQCRVKMDDDKLLLCSYRRSTVFTHGELRERSPVAVGDRVEISRSGDVGVVEGVAERKNKIHRIAPGDRGESVVHVLAANLDLLVIVASAHDPDFSPGLVDRFLIAAQSENIPVLLCATKMDLVKKDEDHPWDIYKQYGVVDTVEISAKTGQGIPEFRKQLIGKVAAFCGHSGVGKTSILTQLLGTDAGRVGEVSTVTGKGRHTTTGAVLLDGPEGSRWIDTPGVKEFGLVHVSHKNLHQFYPEFSGLECTLRNCLHAGEADCNAGQLSRHASYLRIFQSLEAGEH